MDPLRASPRHVSGRLVFIQRLRHRLCVRERVVYQSSTIASSSSSTHANTSTYTRSDTNTDTDTHTSANTDTYAHTSANTDTYAHTNTEANTYTGSSLSRSPVCLTRESACWCGRHGDQCERGQLHRGFCRTAGRYSLACCVR